jgi:hypothetical protein
VTPPDLAPYIVLLVAVTEGRLSPADFATVYVTLFKKDDLRRSHAIYEVLNEVFGAAESHYVDAQPEQPWEVGDDELQQVATDGLSKLQRLVE